MCAKETERTDYTRPWTPPPSRIERLLLLVFLIVFVAFAAVTVNRAAYRKKTRTDAQVYFRGAWAVWSGRPLMEVVDDNGWHYHYPPSMAVVMRPFANAPPGQPDLAWTLPYPISILVWFIIGLVALACALVLFGGALDRHVLNVPLENGTLHRWWLLRLGALVAFLCIAGSSLSRGQVGTILLLSAVGFAVCYADRRPVAAGAWLSLGIAVKIFPVMLALVPLLRRDWRCLAAIGVGAVIGLFLIPALMVGTADTIDVYSQWVTERMSGIASGSLRSELAELNPMQSDMVGFGPVIARLANLVSGPKLTSLDNWTIHAHWICSIILLGLVVWSGHGRVWRWRGPQPTDSPSLLSFSALVMAACVPIITVAQVHYWTLGIPLYMALSAQQWRSQGKTGIGVWPAVLGVLLWIGFLITDLRGRNALSNVGWLTFAMTGLIVYGMLQVRRPLPIPVGP